MAPSIRSAYEPSALLWRCRSTPASDRDGMALHGRMELRAQRAGDWAATVETRVAAAARARKRRAARPTSDEEADDDDDDDEGDDEEQDEGDDEDRMDDMTTVVDGLQTALQRSTAPLSGGSRSLQPGKIGVKRVRDANSNEPAGGVVSSVQFHAAGHLLLVGSMDKKLRFFEVDGERNRKVASVHFPDLPVRDARFAGDGLSVYAVGRRPFFYCYDIATATVHRVPQLAGRGPSASSSAQSSSGADRSLESFVVSPSPGAPFLAFLVADGDIVLVSTLTRQPVRTLHASSPARAAVFSPDGNELLAGGDDGVVHRWDLRTMALLGLLEDEGRQVVSSMDYSSDGRLLAVGNDAGFVNVYDAAAVRRTGFARSGASTAVSTDRVDEPLFRRPATLAPIKALGQLTTRITACRFNQEGTLLATASHSVHDAMRLVHTPTLTTYANWPTARTPLHFVSSVDFSPDSQWLAVGNDRGRVLTYRLSHFGAAADSSTT